MAALTFGTKYDDRKFRNAIVDGEPYAGMDLGATRAKSYAPPVGYEIVAEAGGKVFFDNATDVAYGADGKFAYKKGVTGMVVFDDDSFGDPNPGICKVGYAKKASVTKATAATSNFFKKYGALVLAVLIVAGVVVYKIKKGGKKG
jgi:hypothetical protein